MAGNWVFSKTFTLFAIFGIILPIILNAKIVRHTFRVSYIRGYPDGVLTSRILAINGKFPCPVITAEENDILQITVINNIQDGQNLSIHWHGLHQRGTPFQDGPSGITQCPIKNGKTQVYTFTVPEAGTYWYHSHVNSQYTEGLWGVLIVLGKPEVYRDLYDEEIIITLNDWYHTSGHQNEKYLLSPASRGAPSFPFSGMMNGYGRYPCLYALLQWRICLSFLQKQPVFRVEPRKTYRLRLINTAGWASFNFTVTGHSLQVIEVDGVETLVSEPIQAVHISPGQRYSFLLTIPNTGRIGERYLIRAGMRTDALFTLPGNINRYPRAVISDVTGVLIYSRGNFKESSEPFSYKSLQRLAPVPWANLNFLYEISLIPYDRIPADMTCNCSLSLKITFDDDAQGIRRGSFNHRPAKMSSQRPQLVRMLQNERIPLQEYPVYINYGEIVQVIVNNPELGPHPIHLHGYHFWVVGLGRAGDGDFDPDRHPLNFNGMRRDTVMVKERSWLVIRFLADNVGVWTLHCHVDWHMLTGMLLSFIVPPVANHNITIPAEAKRICADHGIHI